MECDMCVAGPSSSASESDGSQESDDDDDGDHTAAAAAELQKKLWVLTRVTTQGVQGALVGVFTSEARADAYAKMHPMFPDEPCPAASATFFVRHYVKHECVANDQAGEMQATPIETVFSNNAARAQWQIQHDAMRRGQRQTMHRDC
jgi:hypothetical protein